MEMNSAANICTDKDKIEACDSEQKQTGQR